MKRVLFVLSIAFGLNANAQLCFKPKINYATGNYCNSLTSADFNEDAIMDIASTNRSDNTISILLGNG